MLLESACCKLLPSFSRVFYITRCDISSFVCIRSAGKSPRNYVLPILYSCISKIRDRCYQAIFLSVTSVDEDEPNEISKNQIENS